MKKFLYLTVLIAVITNCTQQAETTHSSSSEQIKSAVYDSALAQKFGADEYGMKTYVVALLKKGPNRDLTKEESLELQNEHLKNIIRLSKEGKLVLAGPFFGDHDLRGIYIFDVPTIEEAKLLTETDPAIKKGSLEMELLQWYGSAALVDLNRIHEKIQKNGIIK